MFATRDLARTQGLLALVQQVGEAITAYLVAPHEARRALGITSKDVEGEYVQAHFGLLYITRSSEEIRQEAEQILRTGEKSLSALQNGEAKKDLLLMLRRLTAAIEDDEPIVDDPRAALRRWEFAQRRCHHVRDNNK